MKRIAQVIGVAPDKAEEYIALHKDVPAAVAEHLTRCGYRNYSIFLWDSLLFSYIEYVGDDYEKDLALMAEHEPTRAWWKLVGPLQVPVATRNEGEWWASIQEVYHQD